MLEKEEKSRDHIAQSDEIDESFTKLEQNAETSFLLQQQKNNEMNEAVQQWTALDGKEEKLYDDLLHETEIEKKLREKHEEISSNVDQLGTNAEADEKEFRQLEQAFDTDMRTEKDPDSERVFDTDRSTDKVQKIEEMEKAWYSLEDKIRLKEFELAEESEKLNHELEVREKQYTNDVEREEKQKQLQIARDYADLQSDTPMYAAYSAALNLNHSLMEQLKIPESRNSILKEPAPYKDSLTNGTPTQFVEFEDDIDDFPEYSKMNENRKKILQDTENEAQRVLTSELKELVGIVSGQRQESQALNRDVKWLRENIELRKADIQFYTTKADELILKAQKEDDNKLQFAQQKSQNGGLIPLDLVASRGDVLELREQRIILENERNILANQVKEDSMECDRMNDQWKILKGFAKSVNFDSIRQMDGEIENWRIKVSQLKDQITKLQKMENYASLTNGQLRNNLALLKPYDEEYQEFENLVETNKLLNNQLARQEFRRSVEELKQNGDIDILL
uniref:PH domain-containing protein n=1 Tax=Caenorhabditis tropicalis TaxID=1561998 RepID=A0A1I7TIY8_9PELO